MVKNKDLKKRAIYVYPPLEMTKRWKTIAEKHGTSVSKLVIEHVENSLNMTEQDLRTKANIINENQKLKETVRDLEKQTGRKELLIEKLEQDLKLYRSRLFTDESFLGKRSFDKQLVRILKEPGTHTENEIKTRLKLKKDDVESLKAVSLQISNLEQYDLIKKTGKGWEWTS